MRKVNITALHQLVILKERVDEEKLIKASNDLYLSIKGVKLKGTVAFVDYGAGQYTELEGPSIPEKMRAMAEYIQILLNRWHDLDEQRTFPSRLDTHYGLTRSLEDVLGEEIIKRGKDPLDIIGVCDVIDTWLEVHGEEKKQ